MPLLDRKEMKAATGAGGFLGAALRQADAGGSIAYAVGGELSDGRFGQPVNIVAEYQDHLALLVQFSTLKHRFLVFPKRDVLEWGVLERGSIPAPGTGDRSSTIAGALLYGPIGALVGATMDSSVAQKQAAKPVIGIIYRENGAEQAVFLEFPLASWYRKLNSFLLECLPEQHRE